MGKKITGLSISNLLRRLWRHIRTRKRIQLGLLAILMAVSSLAEVLTIGAVIPFLGVLASPEKVFEHGLLVKLIGAVSLEKPFDLVHLLTVAFCALSITSGVLRFFLVWMTVRVANSIGGDISESMYRRTLYQPYLVHLSRNSSEIISGISGKANHVVGGVIIPIATMISSAFMLSAVTISLFVIRPDLAAVAVVVFGSSYLLISFAVKRKLSLASGVISVNSTKLIKIIQEALGGIREIIISHSQEVFIREFRGTDISLRSAQAAVQLVSASPRFALETIGIVAISIVALFLSQENEGGFTSAIPVLGALALGAQRLLPLLQQAYQSWTSLSAGKLSLKDAVELLEQPLPIDGGLNCRGADNEEFQTLKLENVSFRYAKEPGWIVKNACLSLKRGETIGICGASGAGKSTLIDIVLGLLPPQNGSVIVNERSITTAEEIMWWRSKLTHVPQSIYLFDSSIAENIAFGKEQSKTDGKLIREAANLAQLLQAIEAWPNKFDTYVGERGARLSGGQRQRVGIARALHKRAEVVILDEATSALDLETERDVLNAIRTYHEQITIIMVTHRLNTLALCDSVYLLDGGNLSKCRIGPEGTILKDLGVIGAADDRR